MKRKYQANENSRYIALEDCVTRYCLSERIIRQMAAACGAKRKIGRAARYNTMLLDEYIEKQLES